MPIKNYATRANVHAIIGRIQKMLAQAGARAVSIQYDGDGEPAAVHFAIEWQAGRVNEVRLPARWESVFKILQRDPKVTGKRQTAEHARGVAWRNIEDWIAAQLALIETGQVEMQEVFLPYTIEPESGRTIFEIIRDRPSLPGPGNGGRYAED